MIYVQTGLSTKKLTRNETSNDFDWIADYKPLSVLVDTAAAVKEFKSKHGEFFIAGDMTNPERNNDNLITRSILPLDFDHIDDETKFLQSIETVFGDTAYLLYPSISYGYEGVRYRLLLKPNKDVSEAEFKLIVKNISEKLGYEADSSAMQWSQVHGLPVKTPQNEHIQLINNEGSPFTVDNYVNDVPLQEDNSDLYLKYDTGSTEYDISSLTPKDAINLISEWSLRHEQYLQDEAHFVAIMYFLIASFRKHEINFATLEVCVEVLALGNTEWVASNNKKLHSHLHSRVKNNDKSFKSFFSNDYEPNDKIVWSSYSKIDLKKAMLIDHNRTLAEINKQLEFKADGNKFNEVQTLRPASIAKLLNSYIPMFKTSDEDDFILYVYDTDSGIYTARSIELERYILFLEPNFDKNKVDKVLFALKSMLGVAKTEKNPKLVPVGNGIFDYDHPETLIPYSAEYLFTSKIVTNLVDKPKEPHINDWTPSEFIKSLANNDSQIERLLYEVIADSANSNYSRRKAIFLLGRQENIVDNGNNGKGSFQDLLQAIVGDTNTSHVHVDQLDDRFQALPLLDKAINIHDDLQSGAYMENSSIFNSATTGDVITTDRKQRSAISFRFTGSMIISANKMPHFKNKTGGTYRRILIVPFNNHFEGAGDNHDIKNDYIHRKEVREWFLFMALRGVGWFTKFDEPDVSKEMLAEYKQENDPVREFVDEYELTSQLITKQNLFDEYDTWCSNNGITITPHKKTFIKNFVAILNDHRRKKTSISPNDWEQIRTFQTDIFDLVGIQELEFEEKQVKLNGKNTRCITFPLIENVIKAKSLIGSHDEEALVRVLSKFLVTE